MGRKKSPGGLLKLAGRALIKPLKAADVFPPLSTLDILNLSSFRSKFNGLMSDSESFLSIFSSVNSSRSTVRDAVPVKAKRGGEFLPSDLQKRRKFSAKLR